MTYQEAFKKVASELRRDEGLYITFQANIAMAFYDEYRRQGNNLPHHKVHDVANKASKNFLNQLISKRPQNKGSRQPLLTTHKGRKFCA